MARLVELGGALAGELVFASMHASEHLSRLFEVELDVVCERPDVAPRELLGKSITIKIGLDEDRVRHFNGYVVRFAPTDPVGRRYGYRLSLRPWFWFLTRTSDCRIFQDLSVPDILLQVFGDEATQVIDNRLSADYRLWNYCVQYRESDFNFASRLMEQEGIYYYFEHTDGVHTMVLCDGLGSHKPIEQGPAVQFSAHDSDHVRDRESVTQFDYLEVIQPTVYVLDDYNFTVPGNDLTALRNPQRPPDHDKTGYEVFDYPGEYPEAGDGEQYAAVRIEEITASAQKFDGAATERDLAVGRLFKLEEHPRDGFNDEFLIESTAISVSDSEQESGSGGGSTFNLRFSAIRSAQPWRPKRQTQKPSIQGIQTAVVTGPPGEEIFTDEYGRIKVKFHWDRSPEQAEPTCWIRVAFLAAGSGFGFVSIPRIGHEVVVAFLEGDPDQPLVTGVVYNGDNMPPWELPANKTQSGLLTRSSLGGSAANANAIRFEDKKGAEQVWLHAEKNQDIEVENDETHWVGHDRVKTIDNDETTHVKHDRTETVDNNETITIGVNRVENVGANETVTIGANRDHTIGASESLTVALQRTRAVGVNETVVIGAAQEIAVGAAQVIAVGAAQSVSVGLVRSVDIGANDSLSVGASRSTSIGSAHNVDVGANQSIKVGGDQSTGVSGGDSTTVGKDASLNVTGGRSTSVGKDDALQVGQNLSITAADSITLTTGSSSISMKKDGTITIKGKDITIDGSGRIKIKADGDIVMKGAKILQN